MMRVERSAQNALMQFFIVPLVYVLIYASFCIAYRDFMVPEYGDQWIVLAIDHARLGYAVTAIYLLAIFLKWKGPSTSMLYMHLLLITSILPMLVIYGMGQGDQTFMLSTLFCAALIYLIVILPPLGIRKSRILAYVEVMPVGYILWGTVLAGLAYIGLVLFLGGGRYWNINPNLVYEFRREAASQLPSVFSYFMSTLATVLIPMATIVALYFRHYLALLLLLVLAFLIFALTAHKGPLFYPVMAMILYYVFSSSNPVKLMLFGQFILVVGTLYSSSLGDEKKDFGAYTMRRLYFVPAHLNYRYHDFFSKNEKVLWANSKVTLGLVKKRYEEAPPRIIGSLYTEIDYTGRHAPHANTGWIGSGYANLGFSGMLIYALIVGLLIRFVQFLANKTSRAFAGSAFFVPLISVYTSSDIPTMLLSHGLLVLLGLSLLVRNDKIVSPRSDSM